MHTIRYILLALLLFGTAAAVRAQKTTDSSASDTSRVYVITKHDGFQYTGNILSNDAREVLIKTKEIGQIIIPKSDIRSIRELTKEEVSYNGEYKTNETFSTRYFLTPNGLPIGKGENYLLWSLYGPEIQLGVAKNFGIGIMTTWVAAPVIFNAKYSVELAENTYLGLGALLGYGSWIIKRTGIALPFASLTFGNRRSNITFSSGYGTIFGENRDGKLLVSVAGMAKVSNKMSLVFDSFIMPGTFTAFTGGLRIQTKPDRAFQFGFVGLSADGDTVPVPVPALQWFKKI